MEAGLDDTTPAKNPANPLPAHHDEEPDHTHTPESPTNKLPAEHDVELNQADQATASLVRYQHPSMSESRKGKGVLLSRLLPPQCVENTLAVTVKQIKDASSKAGYRGRMVISNSQVYTVRICGMLSSIEQEERSTDFTIYDGTGTITCKSWRDPDTSESQLTGASLGAYYVVTGTLSTKDKADVSMNTLFARQVRDHNEITMHLLTVIYEYCELELKPAQDALLSGPSAQLEDMLSREGILCYLANTTIRDSESGASLTEIEDNVGIEATKLRGLLEEMLNEGTVSGGARNYL